MGTSAALYYRPVRRNCYRQRHRRSSYRSLYYPPVRGDHSYGKPYSLIRGLGTPGDHPGESGLPVPCFHSSGDPFLIIYGFFSGIFLGSWILALAEVASMFPIFARRIQLTGGIPAVIIAMALGKCLGTLLYYYRGWQ